MKMKNIQLIIFFFLLFFNNNLLKSQASLQPEFEKLNLQTNFEQEFTINDKWVFFKDSLAYLEKVFFSVGIGNVESHDGEFAAFFYPSPISSIDFATSSNLNEQHLNQVRANLRYSLQSDDMEILMNGNVHYYTKEEAKMMFNADTVITYPIQLHADTFYKGKFKNAQVWIVQKNNIGYIQIFALFTDNGIKNKQKYLELLEKTMRFDDKEVSDAEMNQKRNEYLNQKKEYNYRNRHHAWNYHKNNMNIKIDFEREFSLVEQSCDLDKIIPEDLPDMPTMGRFSQQIESPDKEFRALCYLYYPDFLPSIKILLGDNYNPSTSHLNQTSNKENVYYYSSKEAKNLFNADTLITYPVQLHEDVLYKNKYNSAQVLILQKNDTGYMLILELFTNNSIKSKEKYMKLLSRTIRFKEKN